MTAADEIVSLLSDSPEKDFTMKRFALLLACTVMLSSSGCCLFGRSWCGGGGGGCSPCGGGYGAGYTPSYQGYAPAGGGCPTGQCGQYPGAYVGGAPTAVVPYGYPQQATLDPMPVY